MLTSAKMSRSFIRAVKLCDSILKCNSRALCYRTSFTLNVHLPCNHTFRSFCSVIKVQTHQKSAVKATENEKKPIITSLILSQLPLYKGSSRLFSSEKKIQEELKSTEKTPENEQKSSISNVTLSEPPSMGNDISKSSTSEKTIKIEQKSPELKNVEEVQKPVMTSLVITDISSTDKSTPSEEMEAKLAREASWRTMKYTLIFLGISFIGLSWYLVMEFGKPPVANDGTPLRDEFSTMPTWMQYVYRTLREVDYYKRLIREPSREKLLPDELAFPYFQPKYTLVLELTDVLVHPDWTYQTGWRFKKRPGIDHFLEMLSGAYEIVVYTAEQGMTVFPIIEALDPKNLITYKLVRDATHFVDGVHVKNLDKLNRDLKRVIVVDWNYDSVKFHPENTFHIDRWTGNDDDTTLIDLTAFLITVANSEVEDVRDVLNYYNQFDNGLLAFREKQRFLLEQQEAELKNKVKSNPLTAKNWTQNLLNKPLV